MPLGEYERNPGSASRIRYAHRAGVTGPSAFRHDEDERDVFAREQSQPVVAAGPCRGEQSTEVGALGERADQMGRVGRRGHPAPGVDQVGRPRQRLEQRHHGGLEVPQVHVLPR